MNCVICDNTGIVFLYDGPDYPIKAPCPNCSFHRKLEDLEDELASKVVFPEVLEERRAIQEHNKRMEGL